MTELDTTLLVGSTRPLVVVWMIPEELCVVGINVEGRPVACVLLDADGSTLEPWPEVI